MQRKIVALVVGLVVAAAAHADTPGDAASWSDLVSEGKSLVFGRFVGKFESSEFSSRRVRLRNEGTGKEELLEVDDGIGYIAETIPPGLYSVVSLEAVYVPRVRPFKPGQFRPIRQKFGVKPKTGDVSEALLTVPPDRPVYIGTIEAAVAVDGVIYRGHQLRVYDEYDQALDRLSTFYPRLAASLDRGGVAPGRHFILKPSRRADPLEGVIGVEDPIRQSRDYIAQGKFKQAVNWLETFMPTSDDERNEVRLLVGEALLGDSRYPEAIEELGEVLLANPKELRALRLLARAHAYNRNLPDAQNLYEALAEAVPEDAEAHLHLGYLYALKDQREKALEQFGAAFQTDFDYLLHDVAPFAVAMRAVFEDEEGTYQPPRLVKFDVQPPKNMDSRRSGRSSSIAVLVDHRGKVVAAHLGGDSSGSTPLMMVSLVKATYAPASLNGIPIPALLTMGEGEEAGQ
ncbi:MAG: tetratricopeptide repeat protein [Vicinamibacteria bacterium]